jgi:hypothetical protein
MHAERLVVQWGKHGDMVGAQRLDGLGPCKPHYTLAQAINGFPTPNTLQSDRQADDLEDTKAASLLHMYSDRPGFKQ